MSNKPLVEYHQNQNQTYQILKININKIVALNMFMADQSCIGLHRHK